jgi:hypothetical protein
MDCFGTLNHRNPLMFATVTKIHWGNRKLEFIDHGKSVYDIEHNILTPKGL